MARAAPTAIPFFRSSSSKSFSLSVTESLSLSSAVIFLTRARARPSGGRALVLRFERLGDFGGRQALDLKVCGGYLFDDLATAPDLCQLADQPFDRGRAEELPQRQLRAEGARELRDELRS